MIVATLLTISATITAVLAYPAEKYDYYSGYETAFTFPCGDSVPNWIADIGFGTPGQKSSLLIDTSANMTWTAGIKCHDELCTSTKNPLYDAGKSSTSQNLHQIVNIDYGDGKLVDADYYKDDIQLGDVCIKDFAFGKAFAVRGFDPNGGFAGVLGLGGTTEELARQTSLRKRVLGGRGHRPLSLTNKNKRKRSYGEKTCELGFGINRQAFTGDIAWLDIPTCDYGASPFWKAKLDCVKIDGVVDFKLDKTVASFDSSVKFIEAPHDQVTKIHEGLGATYNANSQKYEFDCCNAKDLTFSFKKYDITIPSNVWTTPSDSSGKTCTAKIEVSKSTVEPITKWQLGTSFLENFYSVYSYDRVQTGLALLVDGEEGLKITTK